MSMDSPTAPDFTRAYAFHHGFAFRRERFGGILYHYEGVKPDPRVTFVDNPFLLALLERVDDQPLETLIAGVCRHFALPPAEESIVRNFFALLIERGALVAREDGCEPCGAVSPPAASPGSPAAIRPLL
jgi:putative mycofactocin binding protein MftB